MKTGTDLQPELKSPDEKYRELHSNLIHAVNNNDESRIVNLLSQIQLVAKEQAERKKQLDEPR